MSYAYDSTATCPVCGFKITAKNPRAPMGRHIKRCPSSIEELAIMCGVPEPLDPNKCWIPKTATRGPQPRAKVSGPEGTVRAHQRAFQLHNGRKPHPGMLIMHECDNNPCVNPRHFKEGTQLDNIQDCIMKGRSRAHGGLAA